LQIDHRTACERKAVVTPLNPRCAVSLRRPADWPASERLCRELYAELLDDLQTQLNGRGGRRQKGIDLWGNDRSTGELTRARQIAASCCRKTGNGKCLTWC
jgi:hypothetical protein